MTRARRSLLLPLLAIVALAVAACQTERKPLTRVRQAAAGDRPRRDRGDC